LDLWALGGLAANQTACNTYAVGYPGQITFCYYPADNNTIESIFLSATDNSGNLIYQKTVSGVSYAERLASILGTAKEVAVELKDWIKAFRKAGTLHGGLTEIDVDGDGTVTPGTDLTNDQLADNGTFMFFISRIPRQERSPWNGSLDLWALGGLAANQTACNTYAVGYPGQITFCYYPADDNTIEAIFVSATDNSGNLVYQKTVSTY
jgi:hypothetical protein